MAQGFVIMQIGDAQLDSVFERAIDPALGACGLAAKRVDRHNRGGLLPVEIVTFIDESEILIADLTNERPNCYLEVGYAIGVGKHTNLILTAREDHDPESPRHRPGGPRIHFDLAGYDILLWSEESLDAFRDELEKRIRRRLLLLGDRLKTRFWTSEGGSGAGF
jgi:hypothetical protein